MQLLITTTLFLLKEDFSAVATDFSAVATFSKSNRYRKFLAVPDPIPLPLLVYGGELSAVTAGKV